MSREVGGLLVCRSARGHLSIWSVCSPSVQPGPALVSYHCPVTAA